MNGSIDGIDRVDASEAHFAIAFVPAAFVSFIVRFHSRSLLSLDRIDIVDHIDRAHIIDSINTVYIGDRCAFSPMLVRPPSRCIRRLAKIR